MLPHDFLEPSLTAIADYSAANFPRDGDSISLFAVIIPQKESRKERSVKPAALIINPAKLPAIAQCLWGRRGFHEFRRPLGVQSENRACTDWKGN